MSLVYVQSFLFFLFSDGCVDMKLLTPIWIHVSGHCLMFGSTLCLGHPYKFMLQGTQCKLVEYSCRWYYFSLKALLHYAFGLRFVNLKHSKT